MANICFDLSAAMQQGAGISRYEAKLASALIKLIGPERYSFFYTSPQPIIPAHRLASELAALPHRGLTVSNKRWRLEVWLRHVARHRSDAQIFPPEVPTPRLFHGMDYIAPPLKAPSIVTVHDLSAVLYPEMHSRYNRWYMRLILPVSLRKATRIAAVSENTRQDIINWLGAGLADRIRVTPLGVSDESYFEDLSADELQAELARFGLDKQPYILSVGTIEPRKNLVRLVEAYAGLVKDWSSEQKIPALVLVGRVGWNDEYSRIKTTAGQHGLAFLENSGQNKSGPQVLLLTGIKDNTLSAFYQHAAITCYPSLYEGFGLPALEALAAGTPLVTSDNSSLPEVTGPDGETALLVNPKDTAQLTYALQTLLQNEELAQKLKQAGRTRARQFSWQRTAELTRQVYREAYPIEIFQAD